MSDLTRITRYVIANDFSPSATEAMRRNVELNGLGPAQATAEDEPSDTREGAERLAKLDQGKVRINEGDAW